MAGPALISQVSQNSTPVAVGREVFNIDMNGATTATITPTLIKAIDAVYVTPTNAAAEGTGYFDGFLPGSLTTVLTGAATATYVVIIEGSVA